MLSFVNRTTASVFMRALSLVFATVIICGTFPAHSFAKDDRRPYVVPGDGDGVGGYKYYDSQTVPTAVSDHRAVSPERQNRECSARVLLLWNAALIVKFCLITHK